MPVIDRGIRAEAECLGLNCLSGWGHPQIATLPIDRPSTDKGVGAWDFLVYDPTHVDEGGGTLYRQYEIPLP